MAGPRALYIELIYGQIFIEKQYMDEWIHCFSHTYEATTIYFLGHT